MSVALTIIRGLPGSGKSTLAKAMLDCGAVDTHYEADMFFTTDGEYRFNPKFLSEAHAWCLRSTKEALNGGRRVVVANTFTTAWEVLPYEQLGYRINILTCRGNFCSIHEVPETTIEKMKLRWEEF